MNKFIYILVLTCISFSCNNPNNELLNDLLDNQINELNEINDDLFNKIERKAKDKPKEYHLNFNSLKQFKNIISNYKLKTNELTYKNDFSNLINNINTEIKTKIDSIYAGFEQPKLTYPIIKNYYINNPYLKKLLHRDYLKLLKQIGTYSLSKRIEPISNLNYEITHSKIFNGMNQFLIKSDYLKRNKVEIDDIHIKDSDSTYLDIIKSHYYNNQISYEILDTNQLKNSNYLKVELEEYNPFSKSFEKLEAFIKFQVNDSIKSYNEQFFNPKYTK